MSESGTSGSGRGRGPNAPDRAASAADQRGGGASRRNAQGRERNRGPQRNYTENAPSQRTRRADPARLVAFEVLRAVASEDAYANLVLPARIRHHGLDKRDAGFATELSYGALRGQGTYDAVLARCVDRPLDRLDPAVLDALRIGTHQLLAMRVPAHAALDQTVGLARAVIGAGPSTLINAVLRKVSAHTLEDWLELLLSNETDATKVASVRYAHPEWIVRAFRQSLVAHGRPVTEIDDLLEADNAAPVVNLVALPGLGSLDEALENGASAGELVEGSALSSGGDLGRLSSVREGTTRVQDVGSQLVARALAAVDLGNENARHRKSRQRCGEGRILAGPVRRARRQGCTPRRACPSAGRHAAGQRARPPPRQACPAGPGRRSQGRLASADRRRQGGRHGAGGKL